MSDYRYQIVDHKGIPSLKIMVDAGELLEQYESPTCDGILTTHIPIDDIEASIKRYRKGQKAMGGKPSRGTPADKRLAANKPGAAKSASQQPVKKPTTKKGMG